MLKSSEPREEYRFVMRKFCCGDIILHCNEYASGGHSLTNGEDYLNTCIVLHMLGVKDIFLILFISHREEDLVLLWMFIGPMLMNSLHTCSSIVNVNNKFPEENETADQLADSAVIEEGQAIISDI